MGPIVSKRLNQRALIVAASTGLSMAEAFHVFIRFHVGSYTMIAYITGATTHRQMVGPPGFEPGTFSL